MAPELLPIVDIAASFCFCVICAIPVYVVYFVITITCDTIRARRADAAAEARRIEEQRLRARAQRDAADREAEALREVQRTKEAIAADREAQLKCHVQVDAYLHYLSVLEKRVADMPTCGAATLAKYQKEIDMLRALLA